MTNSHHSEHYSTMFWSTTTSTHNQPWRGIQWTTIDPMVKCWRTCIIPLANGGNLALMCFSLVFNDHLTFFCMGELHPYLFRDLGQHLTLLSVALENETWTCVKMNLEQPAIQLIIWSTQIPPTDAIQYHSLDYSSCTVAQKTGREFWQGLKHDSHAL